MRQLIFLFLLLFVYVALPGPVCEATERQVVGIGSGSLAGVYYPAASAICRLVNKKSEEHGLLCVAETSDGSVANLNAIAAGKLELGIVQSDWQYNAWKGTSVFSAQGPNAELCSLFSLYTEPFTVLARADAGIRHFSDLKGKRVNIGNPGAGQQATMNVVMDAFGWTREDFSLVAELDSKQQAQALCEDRFDAMIYVVGHPNSSLRAASAGCDTVLVNVDGPVIEPLIEQSDYYIATTIPGKTYRGSPMDTRTFGVAATVVASTRLSDDVVYRLVKDVFENLDELRQQHPAFSRLNPQSMVRDGLSAPLHAGALRYYREAGLLKE